MENSGRFTRLKTCERRAGVLRGRAVSACRKHEILLDKLRSEMNAARETVQALLVPPGAKASLGGTSAGQLAIASRNRNFCHRLSEAAALRLIALRGEACRAETKRAEHADEFLKQDRTAAACRAKLNRHRAELAACRESLSENTEWD